VNRRTIYFTNFFYNRIKNKYITLKEIEKLKYDYKSLYLKIKKKKIKSLEEKTFLRDYKNMDSFIDIHNNKYINEKRKKYNILDNINGYPLDDYQSRVVLSNESSSLVVAGAGSGKSLTIIGKIVYLVKIKDVNPEDILCISFTNDATINLKHNIQKNYNFDIDIYTFHKLALEILHQNNIKYQIAPDDYLNKIIDNFFDNIIPNNELYLRSLKYILGKNYQERDITNLKRLINTFISLFKSNNYDTSYFLDILKKMKFTFNLKEYFHNKKLLLLIINIYLAYEQELHNESALDFNDMINKSITVLKEYGLKKKWQYIIVDEYQDTSITKFNMINEIIKIKTLRRKIMKATGVVRRIDDLGRVVIPKEIRKTLRIKEGDPLEIFTDKEGEVILKKYSPIGELSEFATEYAETLAKTTGHIACITDKDTVIAVSGGPKKEFLEQSISNELEKILEDKENYTSKENNDLAVPITKNDNKERRFNSQVVYPIISDGDVIGSVILLSKDTGTKMSEVEQKVVQSAATFLGKQMEI